MISLVFYNSISVLDCYSLLTSVHKNEVITYRKYYKHEIVKSIKALVLKDTYPTVHMQTLLYTVYLHRMHIYNSFTNF